MTQVLSLWRGLVSATDNAPRARDIIAEVAAKHGLTVAEISNRHDRRRGVAWPRQEAAWRCRRIKRPDGSPRYSYHFIGTALGGFDHTTVLHGERQHDARLRAAGTHPDMVANEA